MIWALRMLIFPQDSLFTNPLDLFYTCEAGPDFHRLVSFLSFHVGMFQSQTEPRRRALILTLILTLKQNIYMCVQQWVRLKCLVYLKEQFTQKVKPTQHAVELSAKLKVYSEGFSFRKAFQHLFKLIWDTCWGKSLSVVFRWLKFEEDVEDGGERWSKPYVATLSLHSLFELRSCILNGTVLLDMRAGTIEEIAGEHVNQRWADGVAAADWTSCPGWFIIL